MNTIKQLEEEKNALIAELEQTTSLLETEKRSMTDEEIGKTNEKLARVETINAKIAKIEEEKRSNAEKIKGAEKMENKGLVEKRALAEFIRNKEVRANEGVSITSDGAAVIPEGVENNIVEKLDQFSEVFAEARKLPSNAGSLKIPRENSIAKAGFVGELEDVDGIKLDLSEAELTQKRVGAFTGLTNQLVHDAAVDIVKYAEENLTRAGARAIEESIFNGKGDAAKQFKGIVEDKDVAKVKSAEVTIDTLIDLHNALHPTFLPDAKFYMSQDVYNAVSKLKDGNGHPYVQNGIVNGKLTRILFDIPVVVSDQLTKEKPVVLGAVARGYTIMIKKDMFLRHITGDSRNALRGTQLLVLDAYMDGVVHDPQAFVVLDAAGAEG